MSALRSIVLSNLKNIIGWKTDKKIVVLSVDDYGNVRTDSRQALERMEQEGVIPLSRFDLLDTLETTTDLEMLYDALTSVKDINGRHAVLSPFAMPCNINFEKMAENGYSEYIYELLPQTYSKLTDMQPKAYRGAWDLWREGLDKGLLVPQFHGREHFNLKVFEEKLKHKDHEVLTALKNRSYSCISSSGYKTISTMAAFHFYKFEENSKHQEVIEDGLNRFEEVFEYRSEHFNPPGGREHAVLHKTLKEHGVKYIDTAMIKNEHQGDGRYKKVFNYTGKKNQDGQIIIVRNVVFEPTDDRGVQWVDFTMKQIEAAFRWRRPAFISSHRVNFGGHIDPENRKVGISKLKELLAAIVKKWPEVEFMAANEVGDLINASIEK
jgi:hypothetical protein